VINDKAPEKTKPNTHIALLRGINVGGRNKLLMKELVSIFSVAGCENVQTYIQSGNVIFDAAPELALEIPRIITESIHQGYGYNIPVVTRAASQLKLIVESNPFLMAGAAEPERHVVVLADLPEAREIAAIDPVRSPPDEIRISGRELYLRCPNGLARTKFTNAYFDSTLSTTSTIRNWRTTLKLLELTGI